MTTQEFSDQWDVYIDGLISAEYNSVGSPIAFNEYEKSVFLTKAQEELVKSYYSGKNQFGDSFESSEEIRKYLSELVKTAVLEESEGDGITENSHIYSLPPDVWFVTYESVDFDDERLGCKTKKDITVVPTTQDDYHRIKNNPFRSANERKVLRLDVSDGCVELISNFNIGKYLVRYLAQPTPIILTGLPDGLEINGENKRTECKLNPVIHNSILEMAVRMALSSRVGNKGQ